MGKKLANGVGVTAAVAAAALCVALSACGPGQSPAPAPESGTVTAGGAASTPAPTENWSTFTSTVMGISFRYPSEWSVVGALSGTAQEGPTILDAKGVRLGFVLMGNGFDFQPCAVQYPYELLASVPISVVGMDTSQAPTTIKTELDDRSSSTLDPAFLPGGKPVSVSIQMYAIQGQPAGTTKTCGPVGVIKRDGEYGQFGTVRGFDTVQEAKDYVNSSEYDQIIEMISSLKFL